MSSHSPIVPPNDSEDTRGELPPRGRTVGVVVWCSFLVAAAGTMVLFAFLDPGSFRRGLLPEWWVDHYTVYALGFFLLWLVAAGSAALTIYMAHTDRRTTHGDR